jgi:hypothetical protein
VSRDIVFDEGASLDWSKDDGDNAGAGDDFIVDYIISEPAGFVSTPAARCAAAEKRGEKAAAAGHSLSPAFPGTSTPTTAAGKELTPP